MVRAEEEIEVVKITIGRCAVVLTGNAGVWQVLGKRIDDLENYLGRRSTDQAGVAQGLLRQRARGNVPGGVPMPAGPAAAREPGPSPSVHVRKARQ